MKDHEKVSAKLLFAQPFMRFWFSIISPNYKGIKAGEYDEFYDRWREMKLEFTNHIYQQLFLELVKKTHDERSDDKIMRIGSYWDTQVEIDLLAKTKSGKMIAGTCKFSKDIISRGLHIEGLHIEGIDCIINFDLPRSPADYIHRIGRTGRAGQKGLTISFIDHETQSHFKLIEKRSQIKLERESIKGYELKGEAPKKVKGPAPVKGKKKSKKDKLRELVAKNSSLKK